jgi:hypothetical protein
MINLLEQNKTKQKKLLFLKLFFVFVFLMKSLVNRLEKVNKSIKVNII